MDRSRRAVLMCFTTILLACTSAKSGDNRVPQNPVFKVRVDTVFLGVSVTDPLDRCVTGLNKEKFRVYEDKVEQKISSFSEEFSSVSVGILLDTTGSMKTHNNLAAARGAAPVPRQGKSWRRIFSNPLGDPTALPVRQQKFDRCGSP